MEVMAFWSSAELALLMQMESIHSHWMLSFWAFVHAPLTLRLTGLYTIGFETCMLNFIKGNLFTEPTVGENGVFGIFLVLWIIIEMKAICLGMQESLCSGGWHGCLHIWTLY
jgi:hypothetical protein